MSVKSDKDAKDAANRFIDLYVDNGQKPCELTFSVPKGKYSGKQRKALHVWCEMCADVLNSHGMPCYIASLSLEIRLAEMEFPMMIDEGDLIETVWSMVEFKEQRYKLVLKALSGKVSTEDQNSVDPSKVAQIICKRYADHGITLPPWPSLRGQYL